MTPCFFCPPHIDENIAERGTPAQRDAARRRLQMAAGLRARRVTRSRSLARTPGVRSRLTYTADHVERLRARLVRDESSSPSGDADIDEVHTHVGEAWDFYRTVFGRDSLDAAGAELIATVHYGQGFDNAFWDGDEFACGHPEIFATMTGLTIVIHELTHGVTEFSGGLTYYGQSGTLHEHLSDVMAVCAEQWLLGQTPQEASWLVGAECFQGTTLQGRAIRAMKDPPAYDDPLLGQDPTRNHMNELYTGYEDNGGVHINTGIPNRAFVLAALEYGGPVWQTLGPLWYLVLTGRYLQPDATFQQFADATIRAATDLMPSDQPLRDAWAAVGITVGIPPAPPDEPPSDCSQFLRHPIVAALLADPQVARLVAQAHRQSQRLRKGSQ